MLPFEESGSFLITLDIPKGKADELKRILGKMGMTFATMDEAVSFILDLFVVNYQSSELLSNDNATPSDVYTD